MGAVEVACNNCGAGMREAEGAEMSKWPRYPTLFEINTWVWLSELGKKVRKPVDLGSVPASEWDAIAASGFDAVWLMGVWAA